MYCSRCGRQNPDNINYCQSCGAALRNAGILSSKKEYIRKYHSEHSGYYALIAVSLISDIIGTIIICLKIANTKVFFGHISSRQQEELVISIIIGAVFWAVGSILLAAARSMDRKAGEEYEQMLLNSAQRPAVDSTPISANSWLCQKCGIRNPKSRTSCVSCGGSSTVAGSDLISSDSEWKCPNCGRTNRNYVGTCGCGEEKPR